jgi:hypothetical protein
MGFLERVKSVENFEELAEFGNKARQFAEEIQNVSNTKTDNLDERLQKVEQAGTGSKGEGKGEAKGEGRHLVKMKVKVKVKVKVKTV